MSDVHTQHPNSQSTQQRERDAEQRHRDQVPVRTQQRQNHEDQENQENQEDQQGDSIERANRALSKSPRERREEERQKNEERFQAGRERNAFVQEELPQRQAEGDPLDREELHEVVADRVKQEYENIQQPGMHPANRPSRLLELRDGERDPHKTTPDLEDITGNPGHLNINPNAPGYSMNPAPGPDIDSINEPAWLKEESAKHVAEQLEQGDERRDQQQDQLPDQRQTTTRGNEPEDMLSINEPPGSDVMPELPPETPLEAPPEDQPFDQQAWDQRQQDPYQYQDQYQDQGEGPRY